MRRRNGFSKGKLGYVMLCSLTLFSLFGLWMAHLLGSNPNTSHKLICSNLAYGTVVRTGPRNACYRVRKKSGLVLHCSSTSSSQLSCADQKVGLQIENNGGCSGKEVKKELEYLVCEYGWRVRRLIENTDEIKIAAQVQAEAFHVPLALFNDLFFQFFKVLLLIFFY